MFRCIKYSRYHYWWMLLLTMAVVAISALVFGWWHTAMGYCSGSLLILAVISITDALVDIGLRRAFKGAYSWFPEKTSQTEVSRVLRDLAVQWQSAGNEESASHSGRVYAGKYTQTVAHEAAKQKTGFTMKTFWHTHWLARIFDFEVKKSWKEYLPPAQAA